MEKQRFILISDRVRHNAVSAVMRAPENFTVTVAPANRSNDGYSDFRVESRP